MDVNLSSDIGVMVIPFWYCLDDLNSLFVKRLFYFLPPK